MFSNDCLILPLVLFVLFPKVSMKRILRERETSPSLKSTALIDLFIRPVPKQAKVTSIWEADIKGISESPERIQFILSSPESIQFFIRAIFMGV